jgi:hypothetical protein
VVRRGSIQEEGKSLVETSTAHGRRADRAENEEGCGLREFTVIDGDKAEQAFAVAPALDVLDGMSDTEFRRRRVALAEELGMTRRDLEAEYKDRAKAAKDARPFQPHWDVEPWQEPVNCGELIEQIERRIKRHIITSDEAILASALWIAFSWGP